MNRQSGVWKKMMMNGSMSLYGQRSILEKDVEKIEAEGFEVFQFDCAAWDNEAFHTDVAKKLSFPAYYGRNINAFNDCLSELEPVNTGILLVLCNYELFLTNYPELAIDLLEVIQINSWRFLLEEKGLMGFVQSNDLDIQIPAVGGMSPQWNGKEWFDKDRKI